MKKLYQIKEYGSFVASDGFSGYTHMRQETFEKLKQFILLDTNSNNQAFDLMGISYKKGIGEVITAKNYVGMIAMNDGTTIEILPKVCSHISDDDGTKAKKLLIDMLRSLRNSPYKNIQTANVNIENMSIFEIFIRMFVEEVLTIVKHGLKCSYDTIEENETAFKGKLLFSKQVKYNFAHKERSYVEYDVFSANRAENRLIKSTLHLLYKHTKLSRNKTDIKNLLNSFDNIPESVNYSSDFTKCISDRNTKDYARALIWCKIFLQGKSFSSFAGNDVAYALLFPMETLFESFIAQKIIKALEDEACHVSAQDKSYYLFDLPEEKFGLRPDIVITRDCDRAVFVMDTKWKLLTDDENSNFGISQADMYQMYAYQKKYKSKNVTLIYPQTDLIDKKSNIKFLSSDGVAVNVKFVDLFDVSNSLRELLTLAGVMN